MICDQEVPFYGEQEPKKIDLKLYGLSSRDNFRRSI